MQVFIAESEIRFTDCPFVGASVYPHGTVAVGQIRDVDPAALPPEVRTVGGETLFVRRRGSVRVGGVLLAQRDPGPQPSRYLG
ncbi:hypothetical protein [Nocardia sp. NPDC050718]|uniref:hypothetical protein n=1 Tax=Nocardia sp. NPDC050718 TaxID=3155788 RepID=UPI0033E9EE38